MNGGLRGMKLVKPQNPEGLFGLGSASTVTVQQAPVAESFPCGACSGEIHVYAGNSKLPKDLQASETSPFTFSAAGFLDPAVRQLLRSPRAMLPEENGNSHEKPASQGHSQGRK